MRALDLRRAKEKVNFEIADGDKIANGFFQSASQIWRVENKFKYRNYKDLSGRNSFSNFWQIWVSAADLVSPAAPLNLASAAARCSAAATSQPSTIHSSHRFTFSQQFDWFSILSLTLHNISPDCTILFHNCRVSSFTFLMLHPFCYNKGIHWWGFFKEMVTLSFIKISWCFVHQYLFVFVHHHLNLLSNNNFLYGRFL